MSPDRIHRTSTAPLPEWLHRIIPLTRFLEMLETGKAAAVSPAIWDDPYEAAPLKIVLTHPLFRDVDGAVKIGMKFIGQPVRAGIWQQSGSALRLIYCQSWTATPETDTMWRAYSPHAEGVRIRAKTLDLACEFASAWPEDSCFLGEVAYVPQTDLDQELADPKACYRLQRVYSPDDKPWGHRWLKPLTRKRIEFAPEHEFRLILFKNRGSPTPPDWPKLAFFEFPSHSLIESVMLDPRTKNADQIERDLRSRGFSGKIEQSQLYRSPQYDVWNSNHPR